MTGIDMCLVLQRGHGGKAVEGATRRHPSPGSRTSLQRGHGGKAVEGVLLWGRSESGKRHAFSSDSLRAART